MKHILDKQLILESITIKPRFIVMKGNPKYWITPQSKQFYDDIKQIAKQNNFKYEEYESDIWLTKVKDIKKLSKSDVVISFSRGCGYIKAFIEKMNIDSNFIGIGCSNDEVKIYDRYHQKTLKNSLDKTDSGDMSDASIKNHWTLTVAMKKEINTMVKNINTKSITPGHVGKVKEGVKILDNIVAAMS